MFSLLVSRLYRSGVALSSSLVMTKGLCWRLPVGRPEAASRGEITSWLTAMTMILFSRPAWVTEPLIGPDFSAFSLRYPLSAMRITPWFRRWVGMRKYNTSVPYAYQDNLSAPAVL